MLLMSTGKIALAPLTPSASSLAENVLARVRTAVHDGVLSSGELYSVYQLAEALGVSRSPAREALLRLAEIGLVRFERNRGFRIVLPSPHEIAEVFAIRLALELPAVRRVARDSHPAMNAALGAQLTAMEHSSHAGDERLFSVQDQRLHDLILAAAGNNRSRAIVNELRDTTRLLGATSAGRSRSLSDIHVEHRPIAEAIAEGDQDAAAAALRWHIVHTGRLLVHQLARDEGEAEAIWSEHIDAPG